MRVITSLTIVACLAVAGAATAQPGKPAPGKAAIRACEVLTRDVVAKFDTGNPKMRGLIPRSEEAIGSHGSSCNDGAIFVQIDPFLNSDTLRKSPPKDWQAVPGVGDTAYFHNNRDRYAELMVWTGGHHFTIQLSVPDGSTAEKVKPNTIGIAAALIARLKSM
ncbi:MAG TPA: hypothetical protein VF491_00450 [Vicinamibacterales bacterium]